MNILKRKNKKGDKIIFYYDFGRAAGQRPSTGIFIYTKPKDQLEKNHNKEALALIEKCLSPLNSWTKIVNQFSHLNLGVCQEPAGSFL